MANSNIIGKIKKKIIKELIKDNEIVKTLNSDISFNNAESLINTHIFDFYQNPFTINESITFITVSVHIPEPYLTKGNDDAYVQAKIEINIISHFSRMVVNDIPKVTDNRNDYLSELLDKKFNGRDDFGIGKLVLKSNTEGAYQKDYLYRQMIFKTSDLNNSLCDMEDY